MPDYQLVTQGIQNPPTPPKVEPKYDLKVLAVRILFSLLGAGVLYYLFKPRTPPLLGNPQLDSNSALTAITRGDTSLPAKILHANGAIVGKTLDYGCGKGEDADNLGLVPYDPYHCDNEKALGTKYDTITCTYVLNTIPKKEADKVIQNVKALLKPNGKAYFTVRRDIDKTVHTDRGTMQRKATVKDGESVYKDSTMEIYEVKKQ